MSDKEMCEKYGLVDNFFLSYLNIRRAKSRRPLGKPCARNWDLWFLRASWTLRRELR
ncbi:MAG: hypothetical protein LBF22_07730 [Deltaproteobacteria bacterium]|nr:hypothetical protein [Deltaproteobacteria bacterium]